MLLVAENFRTQRDIGFYADKLCVTSKYLSTMLKQETGMTALDWIERHVVLYAKSCLSSTSRNYLLWFKVCHDHLITNFTAAKVWQKNENDSSDNLTFWSDLLKFFQPFAVMSRLMDENAQEGWDN